MENLQDPNLQAEAQQDQNVVQQTPTIQQSADQELIASPVVQANVQEPPVVQTNVQESPISPIVPPNMQESTTVQPVTLQNVQEAPTQQIIMSANSGVQSANASNNGIIVKPIAPKPKLILPEEASKCQATKKEMAMMYSGRLGVIFSNISIIASLVSICSLLAGLLYGVIFLVAVLFALILTFATLGLILLADNSIWSTVTSIGQDSEIINAIFSIWPVIAPIAIASAAISILFLAMDKTKKHTVRIALAGTALGGTAIIFILALVGIVGGSLQ